MRWMCRRGGFGTLVAIQDWDNFDSVPRGSEMLMFNGCVVCVLEVRDRFWGEVVLGHNWEFS